MEHKAFAFDWTRFTRNLRPMLLEALSADDTARLEAFIDRHRAELRDPYEGERLGEDWRELLESEDVQELADFALTRFYRPSEDRGIGYEWMDLSEQLPEPAAAALVGRPLTSGKIDFDPGRMGAYFQTPSDVRRSLAALAGVRLRPLQQLRRLLGRCSVKQLGVYVTF